ncbi:Retron-type RNA-directed DNA polymerase [Caballeronia sordidicola]|uniref:Retron-type RNA-directed DNA polymerase n=2 Tax=Caballeronia sordidicola TaxID=196367 RepID=A0A226WTA3_CABSO|nr:Retron-type RNA-directed DNA polymerase [Caballeronia sordidicola]
MSFRYNANPIRSLAVLAIALDVTEYELLRLSNRADDLYRKAKPIRKPDGSFRQPYDALPQLKHVHRRIKERLLVNVHFPAYLTGSLPGKSPKANASFHVGAKIVICEDVQKFFPSTRATLVHDIWMGFFGFSQDVATILTKLTTRFGALPEGAITSSYLANLVFWRLEPGLHEQLSIRGIAYSRYVDDICVSSKEFLPDIDKSAAISEIYTMLGRLAYTAKRKKHEIQTSGHQMFATKLMVNRRVAIPHSERHNLKSAVFQLEGKFKHGARDVAFFEELSRTTNRVGRLGQFHMQEATKLKERLKKLRMRLDSEPVVITPSVQTAATIMSAAKAEAPWD